MANQVHNGDWRDLWVQYGPKLLLFARQQAPRLSDAEDLVQEAFVRFWKSHQENSELSPALLFLYVKRIAIDHARKWKSRLATETEYAPDALFYPHCQENHERNETIEEALKSLPMEQREVLVLKIWGELTFDEISRTLSISPHTAASRYRYAISRLKDVLTLSMQ